MKKTIFLFAIIAGLTAAQHAGAQSVGIGTSSFTPDVKTILELRATQMGLLIPRMSWANRPTGLLAAQDGLVFYCTDGDGANGAGFYFWNGSAWRKMFSGATGDYIKNQTSVQSGANFNINGTGTFTNTGYSPNRTLTIDVTGVAQMMRTTNDFYIQPAGGLILQPGYPTSGTGNIQIKDGAGYVYGTFTGSNRTMDVTGAAGGLRLGANNWTDAGATYGHIISDNSGYKALMIIGNNIVGNSGRGREVKVWDYLNVQGAFNITGRFYGVGTSDLVTNLNADFLDGQSASAFAAASHTHPWSQITSKPAAWLDAANLIQGNANFNNSVPSGFYEAHNATNAPTAGTWYNMINVRHSNQSNDHGFQIAASYYDENIWTRTYQGGTGNNNGTYTPWRSLIHSGNLSSNAILNQYSGAQTANQWISGETRTGGWFRSSSGGTGWYSEPYSSGIYATTSGEVATYNGSYFRITGGANSSGNLRFDAANPYIYASSYFVAPGGAYFNSGTVYTEAQYQCRGGIHNDGAANLTIAGGTSGTTYFSGPISGMSGYYPSNNMIRLTPNLHLNSTAGYAVILNWDNGTTGNTSTLRIGNGASADVFQVWAAGNTGINTSPSANYHLYAYDSPYTAGTGYANGSSRSCINGGDFNVQTYEFGVTGYAYNDYTRCGGVLGAQWNASYWGALGYKNSGSSTYGGYFTSYTSGSGYMNNGNVIDGVGSGAYGGVMGGWSRGEVLGFTSAGELYASYNLGNEYTSGVSADIVTVNNERLPAYSVTSHEVKVYSDGKAQLVNGYCKVTFNESFSNLMSRENSPTITVSALGECEGIYIASVEKDGFIVKEFHNGQSNVSFSWIAVGTRADASSVSNLPEAIKDQNFDNNMKGVMFNENNKEQNATPIWWDGTKIRFDAPPVQNIIKKEESQKHDNLNNSNNPTQLWNDQQKNMIQEQPNNNAPKSSDYNSPKK